MRLNRKEIIGREKEGKLRWKSAQIAGVISMTMKASMPIKVKTLFVGVCYGALTNEEHIKKAEEEMIIQNIKMGKFIGSAWIVVGILGIIATFFSIFAFISRENRLEENSNWYPLMITGIILLSVFGCVMPFTISVIIRGIIANTLELRKIREEIKINKKNEKTGEL